MASIKIFSDEANQYYTVNFDMKTTYLSDGDVTMDFFLLVSTTMKTKAGATLPTYMVKDLTDIPPGGSSPAADFTDLMQQYVAYYVSQAGLEESSSSSSDSSLSSQGNSSSSSSRGNSSSSSSSSLGRSSSSSSSESNSSNSSSSSSNGISSSSSSSTLP
jgi:hypothetical protein